jgi:hypothetical protein
MMQKYGSGFERVGHQVPVLDQTIINGEIHYITMQNYLHEQAHLDVRFVLHSNTNSGYSFKRFLLPILLEKL